LIDETINITGSCKYVGGDNFCVSPDYSIQDIFNEIAEDSVHLIFNNERLLRFGRNEWDHTVEGQGTSLVIYNHVITEQDYENAEPITN
ncbi:MAG: hypothetical protein AAF391_10990, partial [Bacteroidota bacterium]